MKYSKPLEGQEMPFPISKTTKVRQLGDSISHVLVCCASLASLWRNLHMYIGNVRVIVFAHCKIAAFLDSGRFFRIGVVRCASMPETVVSPV